MNEKKNNNNNNKSPFPFKPDWRPTENKRSHDSEAETLRRAGDSDKYAGFPALTKEVLETGCKYGAEGFQNFLKGVVRKMAQELRIPFEEARGLGQWDKDMLPMQQVIEVEPETDEQSLSGRSKLDPLLRKNFTCWRSRRAKLSLCGQVWTLPPLFRAPLMPAFSSDSLGTRHFSSAGF